MKMREWTKHLFGGSQDASAQVDPTERLIEELQMALAHERAVNAALLARVGARVEVPVSLDEEVTFEDLKIVNRSTRTPSQMKQRARVLLDERKRDAKTA